MANGDGKAPVGAAISAGVAFVRENMAALAPAAAFTAALNAGASMLANSPLAAIAVAVVLISGVAYQAYVLRLAIHQDRSGFLGLQLGMDEVRLLGVTFAVMFPIVIVAFVGLFVMSWLVTMAAMRAGHDLRALEGDPAAMQALVTEQFTGSSAPLLWSIVAILFVIIIYISARLSVAPPATIGERRMLAFSTFAWTRGNAFRIIAALAPFAIVAGFIGIAAQSGGRAGPVGFLTQFVLNFVLYVFVGAAQLGVSAFLYRGFRPPELGPPPNPPAQ